MTFRGFRGTNSNLAVMGDIPNFVTVSCAEHHETLVQRLWHFYKMGQGLDFDFPTSGGRPILAHLLVVDAFMSPLNFAHFREGSGEGDRDVSASLDSLLEFMYRGTVSVPEEGLHGLLETAKEFDFKMLIDSIEATLKRRRCRRLNSQQSIYAEELSAGNDSDADLRRENSDVDIVSTPLRKKSRVTRKSRKRVVDKSCAQDAASAASDDGMRAPTELTSERQDFGTESGRRGDFAAKRLRQCKQCRFNTHSKPAFRVHMSKHDPSIHVLRCSVCGHRFADVKAIPHHPCRDRNRHRCSHCTFRTYDKALFHLHLATHDPDSAKPVLRCRTCNKPFLRPEVLKKHEASHQASASAPQQSYSCTLCAYVTVKRNNFNHHLFNSHQLDMYGAPLRKNLHCDRCDFRCVRPSELRRHVTVKHSTEKAFKCPICPYAAALRKDLHIHNRRTHLGIKNFPCDSCELKFATNYALERHRRTHTGERPYVCHVCGKAYADSATLRFHAQCHNEGAERHVCHICGHLSKRRQYLKAHLKNVHKLNLGSTADVSSFADPKMAAILLSKKEAVLASPVDFSDLLPRDNVAIIE